MRAGTLFSQTVGTITNIVSTSVGAPFGLTLLGMQVLNTNGSGVYGQVFNLQAGSVTVGTTVPLASIAFATTSSTYVQFPDDGWFIGCKDGLSIAFTTTRSGGTAASVDCNIWEGN